MEPQVGRAETGSIKVEKSLLKVVGVYLMSWWWGPVTELKRLERVTWHNFSIFNDLLLKGKHQFWTLSWETFNKVSQLLVPCYLSRFAKLGELFYKPLPEVCIFFFFLLKKRSISTYADVKMILLFTSPLCYILELFRSAPYC